MPYNLSPLARITGCRSSALRNFQNDDGLIVFPWGLTGEGLQVRQDAVPQPQNSTLVPPLPEPPPPVAPAS